MGNRAGIPVIDWIALTNNLRRHYAPLARVAREVQIDAATLRRLSRGEIREPRFTAAVHLLDLHKDACPERHHELKI